MIFWSSGHARTLAKIKPLYLHYHYVYDHQIWRSDHNHGKNSIFFGILAQFLFTGTERELD